MNIKSYRKMLGISQEKAASEIGVSKDVYNSWEYGVRFPRPENVKKIEEWSNGAVTPNDFYNITERNKNE